MTASWIDIKAKDGGTFGGYLALPPKGKGPGVVVFQEIFGVNGHIRAVTEQYALDGYVALAPDVFWRQQPRVELGYAPEDIERGRGIAMSMKGEVINDIQSTVEALRGRAEVTGKVGAVGYCMGGRLAYVAASVANLDAASSYYGGGIQDQLQFAEKIRCPIQFHYGEKDHAIPMEAVEKVKAAFAGKPAEFYIYEGAEHGFNCWERPSYQQRAAALAHGRTLEFFAKHLSS